MALVNNKNKNNNLDDSCSSSYHSFLDSHDKQELDLYLIHSLITLGVMRMDHQDASTGNRPVHVCAQQGNLPVLQDLVQRKGAASLANVNHAGNTPLHTACWFGHADMVKWMLQLQDDDEEEEEEEEDTDSDNEHHFHHHHHHHHPLDHHMHAVDVHATNHCVSTPLHLACYKGHVAVVQRLLRAQADVTDQDVNGNTALHVACWAGHLDIVELLMDHYQQQHAATGAIPGNAMNEMLFQGTYAGNTALHLAAWNGHLTVVQRLVDLAVAATGDKNNSKQLLTRRNHQFSTPLQLATNNGHVHVAKWLLQAEGWHKATITTAATTTTTTTTTK